MAQPNLIPEPFAVNGDKNTIPESTTAGSASWQLGFPPITALPLGAGGVAPDRKDFNGILNEISAHTVFQQGGGVYQYAATIDYTPPAIVCNAEHKLYLCIKANGPTSQVQPLTNTTYWQPIITENGKLPTGVYDFATDAEVKAGTLTTKPVNPKGIKSAYLPLAGGKMTGNITRAVGQDTGSIKVTDAQELGVEVGKDGKYAGLYVVGPSKDSNPNQRVYLSVGDSTGSKNLIALTATQAQVKGKNIVRSVNSQSADNDGNVTLAPANITGLADYVTAKSVSVSNGWMKYASGLIIQWGIFNRQQAGSNVYSVTLSTPFASTNYIVFFSDYVYISNDIEFYGLVDDSADKKRTATTFWVIANSNVSHDAGSIMWFAIGK